MEGGPRRLLVVRHGERCDFTFNQQGINWMNKSFDKDGKYYPFDINLPRNLPKRLDGVQMFAHDSPLTEMGYLQSKLTGRAFRDHGIKIDHIYSSVALRCVQTAVGIIRGMDNQTVKINLEPGLYEWMRWCQNNVPSWMAPEEFTQLGYPINTSYTPFLKTSELRLTEKLTDFYERSFSFVRTILSNHSEGTVLLVAHGPSLDALTRQLCGGAPRSKEDFMYSLHQIPYLACLQVVEQEPCTSNSNGSISGSSNNHGICKAWKFCGSPIPPLTHASNSSFDTRLLSLDSPFIINSLDLNH